MNTDATSLFWFLVPGVVVPAVLLVLAFWSPTDRQVRRWGAACDVVVTPTNREEIRSRLGRGRRFRSVAAFPFWWLAFVRVVDGDFPAALATPTIAMAAYLIGALVAELTGPVARPDGVRRAALVPRLMSDYRPRWLRTAVIGLFAIAGVLVLLRATVVDDPSGSTRSLAVSLVLALAVVAVAEVAAHRIVERPQRFTDPDLLAADEGLRASAVSMTAAAALLAALAVAAVAAGSAVPEATGAWAALLIPWMLLVQATAFGVLILIVRQETWGYRRRYGVRPAAVPA